MVFIASDLTTAVYCIMWLLVKPFVLVSSKIRWFPTSPEGHG